jgi:hypothetical protein
LAGPGTSVPGVGSSGGDGSTTHESSSQTIGPDLAMAPLKVIATTITATKSRYLRTSTSFK